MSDDKADKKNGMCCPVTGCPAKYVLMATIATFILIFLFEWLFHGILMMPDYEATAELWRDEQGMRELFHFSLISQFLRAMAIASLFCWITKNDCDSLSIATGVKIGLLIGLLSGAGMLGSYAYTPIPLDMAIKWFIGEIVLGVIIGAMLAGAACCVCKKKKEEETN